MIDLTCLEYATDADPSLSYCLWDYPRPAPAEDKWRSVNLLFDSFGVGGIDARGGAVVEALRDAIGPFKTVFGIKQVDGRLAWEFYFYDYARLERTVSISRVLAALRPWAGCKLQINEALPYFMFSIDLPIEAAGIARPIEQVHMYIGNPGSAVSSGIAYGLTSEGARLENFYFFFDARTQLGEVARKVACSAQVDIRVIGIDALLLPELCDCRTICVANKATHDCVYFSGITVDQLVWFLERFEYPEAIVQTVTARRDCLDHLLFDVGFDYRMSSGCLVVLKSGYYGVF